MKSIVYILIAVFASSILFSALPRTDLKQQQELTLQCVDKNYNLERLKNSSSIIESRLRDYGIQDANVYFNEQKASINVVFNSQVNLPIVKNLITSKGRLEFYEVYDRLNFVKKHSIDKALRSILNIPEEGQELDRFSGILGYCKEANKLEVDLFIKEHYVSKPEKGINFFWSEQANDNGDFNLFLLHHDAFMNKSHISESVVNQSQFNNNSELTMIFDSKSVKTWGEITKRNIGRSIAIVLDQKVLQSPRVMSEIKGGKCTISGNFSANEINRANALINNEELPLEFELIKNR